MPAETLRPPDLALDRLTDGPSNGDGARPANRRHLEILPVVHLRERKGVLKRILSRSNLFWLKLSWELD